MDADTRKYVMAIIPVGDEPGATLEGSAGDKIIDERMRKVFNEWLESDGNAELLAETLRLLGATYTVTHDLTSEQVDAMWHAMGMAGEAADQQATQGEE